MGAGYYGYVLVSVGGDAFHGYKHSLFLDFARIGAEADDILVGIAYYLHYFYLAE